MFESARSVVACFACFLIDVIAFEKLFGVFAGVWNVCLEVEIVGVIGGSRKTRIELAKVVTELLLLLRLVVGVRCSEECFPGVASGCPCLEEVVGP